MHCKLLFNLHFLLLLTRIGALSVLPAALLWLLLVFLLAALMLPM